MLSAELKEKVSEMVDRFQYYDRFNMVGLYIALEQLLKKAIEDHKAKEGEVIAIPMENGNTLEMKVYKTYSTLDQIAQDGNKTAIIDEEDSWRKEYKTLYAIQDFAKGSDLGIGYRYPEKLKQYILDLHIGDVLVTDSAKEFVCVSADSFGAKTLQLIDNVSKTPDIHDYKLDNVITVSGNHVPSTQEFFRLTKTRITDNVHCRYTTTYQAQELLNNVTAGLDDGIKQVTIGPNTFWVQKAGSEILEWFDKDGNVVPNDQMKVYIAWMHHAPVITTYRMQNGIYSLEDKGFARQVERLFAREAYREVYQLIGDYCKTRNDDKIFKMRTYFKSGNDYKAVSFSVFPFEHDPAAHSNDPQGSSERAGLYEAGSTQYKMMMADYYDENFNHQKSRGEITKEQFEAICKQKYHEQYFFFENEFVQQLETAYPNCKPEIAKSIIEHAAENTIKRAEENLELFKISVERE